MKTKWPLHTEAHRTLHSRARLSNAEADKVGDVSNGSSKNGSDMAASCVQLGASHLPASRIVLELRAARRRGRRRDGMLRRERRRAPSDGNGACDGRGRTARTRDSHEVHTLVQDGAVTRVMMEEILLHCGECRYNMSSTRGRFCA
eukprot:6201250-Pleurochrysis_carterae.AAC.1